MKMRTRILIGSSFSIFHFVLTYMYLSNRQRQAIDNMLIQYSGYIKVVKSSFNYILTTQSSCKPTCVKSRTSKTGFRQVGEINEDKDCLPD